MPLGLSRMRFLSYKKKLIRKRRVIARSENSIYRISYILECSRVFEKTRLHRYISTSSNEADRGQAIRSALNYHVFYLRDPGKDIEKRFRGMTFAYTFRTNRLASVSIYPFETSRSYACAVCCFAVKADYGVKGPEQDDKWEVGKKVTCHLLVSLKMDRAAE